MGTFAVFVVLSAIVLLVIRKIKKDKAEGNSCCGGCKECALHGKCSGK